jgi:hypothetical protein
MAKNMDIYGANLKSLSAKDSIKDNEKIEINIKELGVSDIYPTVFFLNRQSDIVLMGIYFLLVMRRNMPFIDLRLLKARVLDKEWMLFGHYLMILQ